MMLLLALFLAMNVALASSLLSERSLRILYALLSVLGLAWVVVGHIQTPGYEVASLLLFGVLLAGVFAGPGVAIVALPTALLLPLALSTEGGVALAVHNHWQTMAMVGLGAGVTLTLRQGWALAESSTGRWTRASLLALLAAAPATFLALVTPATGLRAGNVLLPMASLNGVEARIVVLEDGGANSWPWLEPLQFALPVALALLATGALLAFAVRSEELRHRVVMWFFALVVLLVWGFLTISSPGALAPLHEVDPVLVVDALRPAFVPADALTYLSPDASSWRMAPSSLALWFGVGAWVSVSALLVSRVPRGAVSGRREHAALAPLVLAGAALLLAEAWSLQALGVASQKGAPGLVFALAAMAAGVTMFRGRMRVALWLVLSALSASWLVAFVATKVIA